MLELQNVRAGYGRKQVLFDVSAVFRTGELVCILGPNGCGKSTLLKTAMGILPCTQGQILLNGEPLKDPGITAKHLAWLPQGNRGSGMTVEQLVLCGRFPHLHYPRRYGGKDLEIARAAMAQLRIGELAEEPLEKLSGGQKQSAFIAMALAQGTEQILLDEPATYLDIANSFSLMETLKGLTRQGKGIAAVLHDIPLAMTYGDRILIMDQGRLVAEGTPEEVLESKAIDRVFGIRLEKSGRGYICTPGNCV